MTFENTLKKPYAIHRQMHIGDMLDKFESMGILQWRWEYGDSTAYYWIAFPGKRSVRHQTREAEKVVQRIANQYGIVWIPVPHYGGKENWEKTLIRIEKMEQGLIPKPWEC